MTIYEKVKSAVTVKQAAERYGFDFDRKGMSRCPFHDDRHPSMKLNEDFFYCFGCGEHGDVIALTAKLTGLTPGEAAKRLTEDFGIGGNYPVSVLERLRSYSDTLEEERRCFRVLTDYLSHLKAWKARYAPESDEEELHARFLETCRMIEPVTYMVDTLIEAEPEMKRELVNSMKENGKIVDLEKYLEGMREKEESTACR